MKPHEQCRCVPDGRVRVSYQPPDPRNDNKRPWHKHTLPQRKGGRR